MTTILDVIDNHFAFRHDVDIATMPGKDLMAFGEEVRRFARDYTPPAFEERTFPVYLGGWPSANVFAAREGAMVLSTLLYCGQVLAKDPLSDWFSSDQYRVEHSVSHREGYLTREGRPNVARTRSFLACVVPAMQSLRPLIEANLVVLAPAESFYLAQETEIRKLRQNLLESITPQIEEVVARFNPGEVTVDDRRKGCFVFAGGDREAQLLTAIDGSLRHFAREWTFAQEHGVEYTAPWPYEQFICEQLLDHALAANPQHATVNAVLQSELPIFTGLSPHLVADLHHDETFAEFRSNLFEVYKNIRPGSGEAAERERAQTEETLLRPILERAQREAESGYLSRLHINLAGSAMSVAARIIVDQATGSGDLGTSMIREGVGAIVDGLPLKRRSLSVWAKLYRHERGVAQEVLDVQDQPPSHPGEGPWFVAPTPSMNVSVTPGIGSIDPDLPTSQGHSTSYTQGVYRLCECGSGLKFKFCCAGIK